MKKSCSNFHKPVSCLYHLLVLIEGHRASCRYVGVVSWCSSILGIKIVNILKLVCARNQDLYLIETEPWLNLSHNFLLKPFPFILQYATFYGCVLCFHFWQCRTFFTVLRFKPIPAFSILQELAGSCSGYYWIFFSAPASQSGFLCYSSLVHFGYVEVGFC